MMRDEEIARVVGASGGDPTVAGEELVRAANAAGGDDNVTVVLFELVEGEPVPRVPREAVAVSGGMSTETIDLERTEEDVRRHGAGEGSRWPALLFVLALLALTALVLWWSFLR
jgi:hypothetical protein